MININESIQNHWSGQFSKEEVYQMMATVFLSDAEKKRLKEELHILRENILDQNLSSKERRSALKKQKKAHFHALIGNKQAECVLNARCMCDAFHFGVNHNYGRFNYIVHLDSVFAYGCMFIHYVPEDLKKDFLIACYAHDLIEDTRESYSDVKDQFGLVVADLVYAVTHEKGKTRKEKASKKYYQGIKDVPCADLLKICDRLSNYDFSLRQINTAKLKMYVGEYESFEDSLYDPAKYDAWKLLAHYNRRAKDILTFQKEK
jgi:hypothetical protein